jgi:hypothetical protein
MPISPEYSWEETEAAVSVRVALSGVSRKTLDVFATEALVKVNAPPYLCHIDLAQDVEDSKTTATIDDSGVTFRLVKVSRVASSFPHPGHTPTNCTAAGLYLIKVELVCVGSESGRAVG